VVCAADASGTLVRSVPVQVTFAEPEQSIVYVSEFSPVFWTQKVVL